VTNYIIERDLTNVVDRVNLALEYQYNITFNCYYGITQFFSFSNLAKLITNYDLVTNVAYNIGFMYTDIMMLVIGVPGETTNDYMYYVFFYIGDFFFRFLFKETSNGYCWYPWSNCTASSY